MKFKIYADASQVFEVARRIEMLFSRLQSKTLRLDIDASSLSSSLSSSIASVRNALQRALSNLNLSWFKDFQSSYGQFATAAKGVFVPAPSLDWSQVISRMQRNIVQEMMQYRLPKPEIPWWRTEMVLQKNAVMDMMKYRDILAASVPTFAQRVPTAQVSAEGTVQSFWRRFVNWLRGFGGFFGGGPPRRTTPSAPGGGEGGGEGEYIRAETQELGLRGYFYMWFLTRSISAAFEPLVSGFEKAISTFEDAAVSFRKTAIVGGIPYSQFQQFQQRLLEFGPRVMMRPREVGELAYAFTTRGYMYPQTLERTLYPLSIAALITGEEPISMAKSILNLMQTWNPMSLRQLQYVAHEYTQQFADIMSYAYARSPLEPRWFKDIANYAAPIFARLGYSPSETMATFMAMSQMMATAGIAVRSMRMALYNLIDPTRQQKVMEQYGINIGGIFEEVAESGGTLADAFRRLYEQIGKLPPSAQAQVFRTLGGGVRGGMALLALRDVVGNIEDYIMRIQKESAGFTTLVGLQYRASPLGMYQAAVAEQQALLYGMGSKFVDVKTALIDLKNALLRFAAKLPTSVVATGVGGIKGLEVYGSFVHMLTNIGMLMFISSFFRGAGGWAGTFGKFASFMTSPKTMIGAVAAGAGITLLSYLREKQLREDLERTGEAGKFLAEAVTNYGTWLKHMSYFQYKTERVRFLEHPFQWILSWFVPWVSPYEKTLHYEYGQFAGKRVKEELLGFMVEKGKATAKAQFEEYLESLPENERKVMKEMYNNWTSMLSQLSGWSGAFAEAGETGWASVAKRLDKTLGSVFDKKDFRFAGYFLGGETVISTFMQSLLSNKGLYEQLLVALRAIRNPSERDDVIRAIAEYFKNNKTAMQSLQRAMEKAGITSEDRALKILGTFFWGLFNKLLLSPEQKKELEALKAPKALSDLSYERILWAWYRGILPFNVLPGFGATRPDLTLHWVRGKFEETVTLHRVSQELSSAARGIMYTALANTPAVIY